MYNENTAIYAYCNSKNSANFNSVLNSLGYPNVIVNDWNQETLFNSILRIIVYALCIPVMFITRI